MSDEKKLGTCSFLIVTINIINICSSLCSSLVLPRKAMERPDSAESDERLPMKVPLPEEYSGFLSQQINDEKTFEDLPHHFFMGAICYTKERLEVVHSLGSMHCTTETNEWVYIGDKGSENARPGEVLVLRFYEGVWTAWDSSLGPNGQKWNCRQAAFRLSETNKQSPVFPRPGPYVWEVNSGASNFPGSPESWEGETLTLEVRETNDRDE